MKFSTDDPRITAYALGEIEDPAERAEIEAAVKASPELQEAVEEIRSMGSLLEAGFAGEPAPELSEFDKARMEQPGKTSAEKPGILGRLLSWPALSALTAAAAVALFVFVLVPPYGTLRNDPLEPEQNRVDATESPVTVSDAPVDQPLQAAQDQVIENELPDAPPPPEPVGARVAGRESKEEDFGNSTNGQVSQARPEPPAEPAARYGGKAEEEQIFELSPFKVQAGPEHRYLATSSTSGTSMSTTLRDVPMSIEVINSEMLQDTQAGNVGGSLAYSAGVYADKNFISSGDQIRHQTEEWNTEGYDTIEETDFRSPLVAPLSTFSIDVDTASYANVRRFLNQGQLPPADAVRIEELINYFPYSDAAPTDALDEGGDPFAVHMAQTTAPWNSDHRLLRIALKGYEMPWEDRPASNLVFLLDVSGSMNQPNKLPLVKEAMDLLVRRLDQRDRVAIVVYAGASGLVLPSTTANNHDTIAHAINNLAAGGSTNAGAGIQLAYKVARDHFIKDGNNRVILCTDGDFNVGQTNRGELADIAEVEADKGVSLTILGFGMGNYKDGMLEELSNKGKGSYAYVDSRSEARKVFLEDLASNIFKIAKDVKIQVEFNPAQVSAYRLIGYENRRLKAEDFNNDKKKAGDIGPGHSVVALYEIIPAGMETALPVVDALRYQAQPEVAGKGRELATVKLRYKQPDGDTSKLISRAVDSGDLSEFATAGADLRFCAAVAAFGMKLRGSELAGSISFREIEQIAAGAIGDDPGGHRSEFTDLVRLAEQMAAQENPVPEPPQPIPVIKD